MPLGMTNLHKAAAAANKLAQRNDMKARLESLRAMHPPKVVLSFKLKIHIPIERTSCCEGFEFLNVLKNIIIVNIILLMFGKLQAHLKSNNNLMLDYISNAEIGFSKCYEPNDMSSNR